MQVVQSIFLLYVGEAVMHVDLIHVLMFHVIHGNHVLILLNLALCVNVLEVMVM